MAHVHQCLRHANSVDYPRCGMHLYFGLWDRKATVVDRSEKQRCNDKEEKQSQQQHRPTKSVTNENLGFLPIGLPHADWCDTHPSTEKSHASWLLPSYAPSREWNEFSNEKSGGLRARKPNNLLCVPVSPSDYCSKNFRIDRSIDSHYLYTTLHLLRLQR